MKSILLVSSIIILVLLIWYLKYNKKESFSSDYEKLNIDYNNFYKYRRTPYTEQQYNKIKKVDPGFGYHMWQLETPNKWNPSMMDSLSQNWDDGSFGQLVSYLEDRNDATAIKNMSV
jgi:hypothetical protein